MQVSSDNIEVEYRPLRSVTPPPPGVSFAPDTVIHARYNKQQMHAVRDAWLDTHLWNSPQSRSFFHCTDGAPILLEACVNGEYAARARNCDNSHAAMMRLWNALNAVRPAAP